MPDALPNAVIVFDDGLAGRKVGRSCDGLKHGMYCTGCCWILMMLLFVAGVMNLFWIAAISVLVLAEKVARNGLAVGRISGAILIVLGVWQIQQ
jgi:predicted metal-binding membrane protein